MVRRQMTTKEIADIFRKSEATVRYWRHIGYGPQWRKVGGTVLYDPDDVDRWFESLNEDHGR